MVFSLLCSAYLINATLEAFFGWSPVSTARRWARRKRALSPTERERLLELEEAEADRQIDKAERGEGSL